MRDLYILETFTDDGLTVRTGPHTIAEAMTTVDQHLAGGHWRHRYLPLTPDDQAIGHWTGVRDRRPALEADFFVALRRAILADPEHDGLESKFVTGLLAHVDPHRPMQLYRADEECLLAECLCLRDETGVCAGMEPADRICVACTAIIDSNTEFGPWFGPSVVWPCPVITSTAAKYRVPVTEVAS
jgi:hypothetical protein